MRISDWSSDVCSSDLPQGIDAGGEVALEILADVEQHDLVEMRHGGGGCRLLLGRRDHRPQGRLVRRRDLQVVGIEVGEVGVGQDLDERSEEHTSELQSLMRISYAFFCLKKKKLTKLH